MVFKQENDCLRTMQLKNNKPSGIFFIQMLHSKKELKEIHQEWKLFWGKLILTF